LLSFASWQKAFWSNKDNPLEQIPAAALLPFCLGVAEWGRYVLLDTLETFITL